MNNKNNPLLTTLKIIDFLSHCEGNTKELAEIFAIGTATLNRHIAEARSMGAKIESVKNKGHQHYRLTNASEIMIRVLRWIDLEEKRDLIERA